MYHRGRESVRACYGCGCDIMCVTVCVHERQCECECYSSVCDCMCVRETVRHHRQYHVYDCMCEKDREMCERCDIMCVNVRTIEAVCHSERVV